MKSVFHNPFHLLLFSFLISVVTAVTIPYGSSLFQPPDSPENITASVLQNSTLTFPKPSRIDDIWWFDADKAFLFGYTQPGTPPSERNALGALVAAENQNLHDYRDAGDRPARKIPIELNKILYDFHGVSIYFDNPRRWITPLYMGDLLEMLAQWILQTGKTAFEFQLVEGEDLKRAKVVSCGGVRKK